MTVFARWLIALVLLSVPGTLLAQGWRDGGRGDSGRGDSERGGDDGDRREEGRGDGGRGWRGGGEGGRGGGDPASFISRMDANGNGQIDPEESQGQSGFFLRRMAENNPNLDLSKPIPVKTLTEEFARARERREAERNGEQPPASNNNSPSASSSGAAKADDRLVPGFGEAQALPEVPGFGLSTNSAAFVVRIVPADRAEAQQRFDRSDDDKDGRLTHEELGGRWGEYQQYDRNKDSIITLDELALRYAARRTDEQRRQREATVAAAATKKPGSSSSSSSGSTARRDDREGEDGKSGSSLARTSYSSTGGGKPYRVATSSERLAKLKLPSWFLDKDKDDDGQIAMAEYGSSGDFAKYDSNGDGLITPEECVKAGKLGSSSRYGSSSSYARGSSGSGRSSSSEKPAEKPAAKPEASDDDDDEGEEGFVDAVASADDAKPAASDEDEDATADDGEAGEDPADSQDADAPERTVSEPSTTAKEEPTEATKPAAKVEIKTSDIPDQYLDYARNRIKQFDDSGDDALQPEEWAKMPKPPAAADANGDKKITAEELATFVMKQ